MVYSTGQFVVCLSMCHFILMFFSSFSIAITSLGEERVLILVLFVRLSDLCLFGFVGFLFLLGRPYTYERRRCHVKGGLLTILCLVVSYCNK